MIPEKKQPWFEFSITLPDGREKKESVPADTVREALEKMRRIYPEARLAITGQFTREVSPKPPRPAFVPVGKPRPRKAETPPPPEPEPPLTTAIDFRAILGLPRDAGPAEVQHAYREAIKRYHPDRVAGLGPELVELAERKTQEFNAALAAAKAHFKKKA